MRTIFAEIKTSIDSDLYRGIYRLQTLLIMKNRAHVRALAKSLELGCCSRPTKLLEQWSSGNLSRLTLFHGKINAYLFFLAKSGPDDEWTSFVESSNVLSWGFGLRGAVIGGHPSRVALMIDKGATNLDTWFERAAAAGQIDIVRVMIDKVPRYNVALTWASHKGHINIVDLLLERMAGQLTHDDLADSLCHAAEGGHREIIDRLFDIAAKNGIVIQPSRLVDAFVNSLAKARDKDIVMSFLDRIGQSGYQLSSVEFGRISSFGRISARNSSFGRALGVAALNGNMLAIDLLLPIASSNNCPIQQYDIMAAFSYACHRGYPECAGHLLRIAEDAKTDFSLWDYDEELPIIVSGGDLEIVRHLLRKIEFSPKAIVSATESAIYNGHVEITTLLIQAFGTENIDWKNHLPRVSYIGHVGMVSLVIKHDGKHLDRHDFSRAIGDAARQGHADVVRFLLEKAGENGYALTTTELQSSIDDATREDHLDIVELLQNHQK